MNKNSVVMSFGVVILIIQIFQPCFGLELTKVINFDTAQSEKTKTEFIKVEKRHSRLLIFDRIVKRVSVADDTVADVLIISPYQIYVNGKTMGTTTLTIWDHSDKVMAKYMVSVGHDLTQLKYILSKILPNEKIEVYELESSIILSGTVSSYEILRKAKAIAIAYAGAQKQEKLEETMTSNILGLARQQTSKEQSDVIDAFYGGEKEDYFAKGQVVVLLEVSSKYQVMLKLCFAEVDTYALKDFNINIHSLIKNDNLFYTLFESITTLPDKDGIVTYSSKLNGMFQFSKNGNQFKGYIDILKNNGMANILAEPNLVCISGKKGSFVVGGEFPVPVPGKDTTTIEWKQYGVLLNFQPEVLSDGKIKLEVSPVVSELDFSSSIVLGGFQIPGLTTRQAKTELVLQNKQEFAIAGLIKQDVKEDLKRYPLLGDIPILGALFRSKNFQNRKTDLVVIVTPVIVEQQAIKKGLSSDKFHIPSDFSFFLESTLSKDVNNLPKLKNMMEGDYGYDISY